MRAQASASAAPPDADLANATAGASAAPLWVSRLSLQSFRNYGEAEIEADQRPVALIGENGAGKTNLLEALSLLAPGRGLRAARLGDLQREGGNLGPAGPREVTTGSDLGSGGNGWAVSARVETPEGPRQLGSGADPRPEKAGRRLVRIDGEDAPNQAALGEHLSAVWLTPQMDRILEEGASGRRRFLDRLVYGFDPAHAGRVTSYEGALRERARLLKAGGADPLWLKQLEEKMAERSVAIAAARRRVVERLAQAAAETEGPFPRAGLGLSGDAEAWLDEAPALAVEDRLVEGLAAARGRDAEAGGAALGAHRTDLTVTDLARGWAAARCSGGEQKALLVSIMLAHARLMGRERGRRPLLLLDEIGAFLDARRRQALFEELLALGAQAWMTGSDRGLFAGLGEAAQWFEVAGGSIRPAAPQG